jgi:hypothetical protein
MHRLPTDPIPLVRNGLVLATAIAFANVSVVASEYP